jgi:hypothetical protein
LVVSVVPLYLLALQLFGANIERQAAEQMEEGKPLDISRTRAAVAAAPGAAT